MEADSVRLQRPPSCTRDTKSADNTVIGLIDEVRAQVFDWLCKWKIKLKYAIEIKHTGIKIEQTKGDVKMARFVANSINSTTLCVRCECVSWVKEKLISSFRPCQWIDNNRN